METPHVHTLLIFMRGGTPVTIHVTRFDLTSAGNRITAFSWETPGDQPSAKYNALRWIDCSEIVAIVQI